MVAQTDIEQVARDIGEAADAERVVMFGSHATGHASDNNLAAARVPCDTVCFHCQQAAEKLQKGVLASRGVPPPRTHMLSLLLEGIAAFIPSVETLRDDLPILTPYAVAARYPDDDSAMPRMEDAREARECAQHVLDWLRREQPEVALYG